jgi:hypothetical protein
MVTVPLSDAFNRLFVATGDGENALLDFCQGDMPDRICRS